MKKKLITLLSICFLAAQAQAQTLCDSLTIDKILYDPLYDTVLKVEVSNHGTAFISYPQFILFGQSGDTLAVETKELFGIGSGSTHSLRIYPGKITGNSITGTLRLYSLDTLTCSFPMNNKQLCPASSCETMYPTLGNFGGALLDGTIDWELRNGSQVVATGRWEMMPFQQNDADTVCVAPGNYALRITAMNLTSPSGQPYMSVGANNLSSVGMSFSPSQGVGTQLNFSHFKRCAVGTGISDTKNLQGHTVYAQGGHINITDKAGKTIGDVVVYSMDGKQVFSGSFMNSTGNIDISRFSTGIYVVRIMQQGQASFYKILKGE